MPRRGIWQLLKTSKALLVFMRVIVGVMMGYQ